MSEWLQWSGHPLVRRLGGTLLHFLWQGAVIAGLFAAAQTALRWRSSNWRYASGCAALALMLSAPLLTFLILGAKPTIPVTPAPSVREFAKSLAAAPVTPPTSKSAEWRGFAENPTPNLNLNLNPNPNPNPNPPFPFILSSEKFLPAFVLAWLLGVLALSLRLLFGSLQVARWKRRGHEPLGAEWLERLHRLQAALQISRPVRLVKSVLVEVPTVVGWLRPVILLPAASLTGLTPGQLETILAHELAHIRRHDYLVNLLQNALETLLFYHPAVWWVSHCVRAEREICCDEIAIELCGDRLVYAQALTTLEELRGGGSALALGADGGSLLERIRRLTGAPTGGGLPGQRRAAGGAFVAALVALIFISLLHHPSSNAKAQSTPVGVMSQTNEIATKEHKDRKEELPTTANQNPSGLSLVIRCTNDVLKVGDEIPIEFVISNHGPESYGYWQGRDDIRPDEFEWDVKTSSGESLPDPHPPLASRAFIHRGEAQGVIIAGETFTKVIVINRWVPINSPGQYVVTATYHPDHDFPRFPTNREPITAAPITITLLPRTTEEMRDYVKSLTNHIRVEMTGQVTDPALLWKLICTGSPEIVPTLFATMTLPDVGYVREALLYHVPHSDEIQDALTNAIAAAVARNEITWNLYGLLTDYGDEHGRLKPFIEWALATNNRAEWLGGSLLALNSAYGDAFTARLAAIAVAADAPPWAGGYAKEALAWHRTDASLNALKTFLNNPTPVISSDLAGALADAFNSRSPSPTFNPVRPEDFDATEMRAFIENETGLSPDGK